MRGREPARLSLELDPGSWPLEGSVTPVGGAPIRFAGWMELMSILEAALEGRLDGSPVRPSSSSDAEVPGRTGEPNGA